MTSLVGWPKVVKFFFFFTHYRKWVQCNYACHMCVKNRYTSRIIGVVPWHNCAMILHTLLIIVVSTNGFEGAQDRLFRKIGLAGGVYGVAGGVYGGAGGVYGVAGGVCGAAGGVAVRSMGLQ